MAQDPSATVSRKAKPARHLPEWYDLENEISIILYFCFLFRGPTTPACANIPTRCCEGNVPSIVHAGLTVRSAHKVFLFLKWRLVGRDRLKFFQELGGRGEGENVLERTAIARISSKTIRSEITSSLAGFKVYSARSSSSQAAT